MLNYFMIHFMLSTIKLTAEELVPNLSLKNPVLSILWGSDRLEILRAEYRGKNYSIPNSLLLL